MAMAACAAACSPCAEMLSASAEIFCIIFKVAAALLGVVSTFADKSDTSRAELVAADATYPWRDLADSSISRVPQVRRRAWPFHRCPLARSIREKSCNATDSTAGLPAAARDI